MILPQNNDVSHLYKALLTNKQNKHISHSHPWSLFYVFQPKLYVHFLFPLPFRLGLIDFEEIIIYRTACYILWGLWNYNFVITGLSELFVKNNHIARTM
jgi:hypothetical protein